MSVEIQPFVVSTKQFLNYNLECTHAKSVHAYKALIKTFLDEFNEKYSQESQC